MKKILLRTAALVVATSLMTGVAPAAEKTHKVQSGESASSIAKHYYGDVALGNLLLLYNGKSGTVIRPEETLKIPYSKTHHVKQGDSWSGLAERYLGRAKAYPGLASLNGLSPSDVLRLDQPILIPVAFSYQIEAGDALASLAERVYGDPALAGLLQTYNELEDPRRLSVGAVVEIPLVSMRLHKPTQMPAAPTPKKSPREVTTAKTTVRPKTEKPRSVPSKALTVTEVKPPARFGKEINAASKAFTEGDYALARQILEPLREDALSGKNDAETAELLRMLAFVYVAFDMDREACGAYLSVPAGKSPALFNPDLVSPRIRNTLTTCRPD